MSAYVNVEQRGAIFAELKGELYKKFRKDSSITAEWVYRTESLLTFAISKCRTEKDIEELRKIIMTDVTEEQKAVVKAEMGMKEKATDFKEKMDKISKVMTRPLCQEGGYGDVILLGSVTLYTTMMGVVTLLTQMIN